MSQKILSVAGNGIAIRGDDIDTDRIIPARFMKEVTFEKMGNYLFYDERFDESQKPKIHPLNGKANKGAKILIVNKNFGCGSSREHAPQSIIRYGFKAIIAESFGDIFLGNCAMIGLVACTASSDEISELMEYAEKNPGVEINIDIRNLEVDYSGKKIKIIMDPSSRESLLNGAWDTTSTMLANKGRILETASKLPYFNNFKQ